MYKAVVLDLDGTLLDDKKNISYSTIEYLINLNKMGIEIIIASGRDYLSIKKIFEHYPDFDITCIALNGGEIIDKQGKVLFRRTIPTQKVLEIISSIKKFDLIYQIYTNQGILVNKKKNIENEMLNFGKLYYDDVIDILNEAKIFFEIIYSNKILLNDYEIKNRIMNDNLEIFKIALLSYDIILLNKLQKHIENIENISLISSHLVNLEILPNDVDKLNGLKNLMKIFDLKKEEIIAFGDNLNDYQMIKFVGKGVAMKNAVEKLKNIADTVTESNNNEGVLKELINVFN